VSIRTCFTSGKSSKKLKPAVLRCCGAALSTDEREELKKLRAENKRLRMEKDILKKASAFFAREMS
jgi:transposase-like protein